MNLNKWDTVTRPADVCTGDIIAGGLSTDSILHIDCNCVKTGAAEHSGLVLARLGVKSAVVQVASWRH